MSREPRWGVSWGRLGGLSKQCYQRGKSRPAGRTIYLVLHAIPWPGSCCFRQGRRAVAWCQTRSRRHGAATRALPGPRPSAAFKTMSQPSTHAEATGWSKPSGRTSLTRPSTRPTANRTRGTSRSGRAGHASTGSQRSHKWRLKVPTSHEMRSRPRSAPTALSPFSQTPAYAASADTSSSEKRLILSQHRPNPSLWTPRRS